MSCVIWSSPSPPSYCLQANNGEASWRKGEKIERPMADHAAALQLLDEWMGRAYSPQFHREVHCVGHRVVHGGTRAAPAVVRWGGTRFTVAVGLAS
jgi:acetate kinase